MATLLDAERLATVRATALLDSRTEESFDRLTRLAARLTGAPVTFISIVDAHRDFYKSCYGFPEPLASDRQLSGTTFCHYTIESDRPLVINDTLADPVYRDVPTVKSLGVRAYLGVPLTMSNGQTIGSFCAIDFQPRKWRLIDVDLLQELAASTLREIELRQHVQSERDERERLDVLLENVPAGVVFAEAPSGRIVKWNRQAQEILGRPLIQTAYDPWTNYRADGTPILQADRPLARALRGEVTNGMEMQYPRDDGTRVWIRLYGAPVRGSDGTIIGGVLTFFDINAQRAMQMENERLYEEAQQANRAKDRFFAAVTHELRTPMTSILGWAQLLKNDTMSDDMRQAIEAITNSARLQARLIDDLLDVSRIESGKLLLSPERIDVNDVIREAVTAAMPQAAKCGVTMRPSLENIPPVNADRNRLKQIIGNLLSNAIKFTPSGGLVEIRSQNGGGFATITVRDTGRGIEPELLPHVFDRNRQAVDGEKGGLGLGLAIAKHLVEAHGGNIRAESEGAGRGATFVVTLPLSTSENG